MFACVRVRPFGACMCRQEPSMQRMLLCGSEPDAARPCARTADEPWQVIDEAHRRMDALLARKLPLDLRAQRQPSAQQIRDPYTCLYGPFWCARRCAQRPACFPPLRGRECAVVRGRRGAGARVGDPSRSCMRSRACARLRVRVRVRVHAYPDSTPRCFERASLEYPEITVRVL